jgi:hypothetical protein
MDSLCRDMQKLNLTQVPRGSLSMLQMTSHLLRDIKEGQQLDEDLVTTKERLHYKLLTLAQRRENVAIGPILLQKVVHTTKSRSLAMVAKSHVAIRTCNRC